MTDPEFKYDFYRLLNGPRPSIEYACLSARPERVVKGKTVEVSVTLRARPVSIRTALAEKLEVEAIVAKPNTTPADWDKWHPLRLIESHGGALVLRTEIPMPETGSRWVIGRARVGAGAWVHVDTAGYDITEPLSDGLREPALVEVSESAKDDKLLPAASIFA